MHLKFFLLLLFLVGVLGFAWRFADVNLLNDETIFKIAVNKYIRAENRPSGARSREWMSHAMELVKRGNLAPPAAARLYGYVASVYADVLEKTEASQASLATAAMIDTLLPLPYLKSQTDDFLQTLNVQGTLSAEAQEILEHYQKRSTADNYNLMWDKQTPNDDAKWYVRNNNYDQAAMAGEWMTWVLADEALDIPSPPVFGSIADKLELEKVKYAISSRPNSENFYFWNNGRGFEKGQSNENITLAGIWQNILFVELTDSFTRGVGDAEYALAQKWLAQGIADSFIKSWQIKYEHWTQRPSMRIPDLDLLMNDPPFPAYVSEYAAVSATAATILSSMYPDKKQTWTDVLTDTKNTRLMAGLQFDADNKMGEYVGTQIGLLIAKKKLEGTSVETDLGREPDSLMGFAQLALYKSQTKIKTAKAKIVESYKKFILKPTFANVLEGSGITANQNSTGASFADYDNDGDLDLFIGGGRQTGVRLYRNEENRFIDVTTQSGLSSPGGYTFTGVFADYDNDGCSDLFLSNDPDSRTRTLNSVLYHNNCNGTFADVTQAAGINNTYHGRGAAWADYDNDGDLDLYQANQGNYNGPREYSYEPNILYHNNGDGTFSDVTAESGATGLIGSECAPKLDLKYRITVIGLGVKASLQPIWLDFNQDNLIDLFIATDSGVSPLYKNEGGGRFSNVTSEAGMCKTGTGMGVTAGDYDNDGDLDIYITNVGINYLWSNNGNGTFTDKSIETGVADTTSLGWGTGFIDYDNDGFLDLYVVNGRVQEGTNDTPEIGHVRIDKLYHNLGNGSFSSVAEAEGILGDDPKEGAAIGDYDNNGFEDIFVISGYAEFTGRYRLYENRGNRNHWLTLQLVGTQSNRDAVGAFISVRAGGLRQVRQVISGASYISQNSLWPTFGLGGESTADEIIIQWPSGITQTLTNVKTNQKLIIEEPAKR